jgi:pentatricopeptide repeat protein
LIEDPRSTTSGGVRPGDVYGLIVEHYVKEGEMETAISVLEKMQKFTDGKSLTHFLSPETTAVCSYFLIMNYHHIFF